MNPNYIQILAIQSFGSSTSQVYDDELQPGYSWNSNVRRTVNPAAGRYKEPVPEPEAKANLNLNCNCFGSHSPHVRRNNKNKTRKMEESEENPNTEIISREEIESLVKISLQKARGYDERGNVAQAYAFYTAVIELSPVRRREVEENFTNVLCEWGLQLEEQNRFQDVISCYKNSLEIYPNNCRMLNNFAAHFLRNNQPLKAIEYLKRALNSNGDFLLAERNLQNVYSMVVNRWHFPMLNDRIRNEAFRKAIHRHVNDGFFTVLDIGTGTGLLTLYARNSGALKIYACEYSPVMASIAKQVFDANDNENNIQLFCDSSLNLRIPEDIPKRVKLVVTEIFDAGLFGEHVIPSLIHAHRSLLDTEKGVVIPRSAKLYAAVVESEFIRHRSSLKESSREFLRIPSVSISSNEETYDSEYLRNGTFRPLTKPREILEIHFWDLEELENLQKGTVDFSEIREKCETSGYVDAVITWFDLELDDSIRIQSCHSDSCWQFAVFPVPARKCHPGEEVVLKTKFLDGKPLQCFCQFSDLKEQKRVFRLPKDVIAFINDSKYVKSLIDLGRRHASERRIEKLLDTAPFPFYGLTLLRENDGCEILYRKGDSPEVKDLIKIVASVDETEKRICFVESYDEIRFLLDCVLVHSLDVKGEVRSEFIGQDCYEFFRSFLNPSGFLLPKKISLMGQLAFSKDLENMVRVKNSNLQNAISRNEEKLEIFIAEFINQYSINHLFDLNESVYRLETSSEAKELSDISGMEVPNTCEQIVTFKSLRIKPNALICWYRINLDEDHIHETNRPDSFMHHSAVVFDSEDEDEEEEKNVTLSNNPGTNDDFSVRVLVMNGLFKIQKHALGSIVRNSGEVPGT